MTSCIIDVTNDFNTNSGYTLDTNEWDYVVVQLVSPSGAVNFTSSNDGGSVGSYGNAISALNFTAVQGTNLASGSAVTSLNASGLVKFNVVGQFLKLSGTSVTATKVIVRFAKIK